MLNRLELELGLPRRHRSPVERALALVPALRAKEGYWSASLAVDPFATAERLLGDLDQLAVWGWEGQAASARLGALRNATRDASPGIADRLARIAVALEHRSTSIAKITCWEPSAMLPTRWRAVLAALRERGVTFSQRNIAATGTASRHLMRPHGALAAADEVAAGLAALDSLDGTVIVGADETLARAMARHGLPHPVATGPRAGSVTLLRLCLEAAFRPMDAADLHALVCAQPGPVPRRIAWRLADALGRFPGRDSDAWRSALVDGCAALEPDRVAGVSARLQVLLTPVAERDRPLSSVQLAERLDALAAWARGAEMFALANQVERFAALVTLSAEGAFTRRELHKLCEILERDDAVVTRGEAGIASVSSPGAVLGAARRVIWWNFTREHAPVAPRLRLSEQERRALAELGIVAPHPGEEMRHAARRWRRAIDAATDAIAFVCPQTDRVGNREHLHPLWDELGPDPGTSWLHPVRAQVPLAPLPDAQADLALGRAIGLREVESPSSLESLLGCSFAYVLHYAARLRTGLSATTARPGPLLYGNLAHHVLALAFAEAAREPERVASAAERLFDHSLPRLAETLMLDEHQADRAALRRTISASARAIAKLLACGEVFGTEVSLSGALDGVRIESRADLVLSQPPMVIDYKWGGSTSREQLRSGAAVQLALYAHLVDGESEVGYFVLTSQRLLVSRGATLGTVATSHSAGDLIGAVRRSIDERQRELARGELVAPGAEGDTLASLLAGPQLRVAPACAYCRLDAICGRRARV